MVSCKDSLGTDCSDIEPPPGQCAVGIDINTLRFKYTDSSCEDDANSQEPQDGFVCKDSNGGPPDNTAVLITCADEPSMNATVLGFERVTMPGDEITVPSVAGVTGPLPESITCVVTSTDGVTEYQKVTINTSGDVDLYLKDKFGSLQLQSCDDNDCTETVTYIYTFFNVGETPMTITKAERERDGMTLDFLADVDPKDLLVGGSTFVTEMERIDVCVDSISITTMIAEADPPDGVPCKATDTYELVTESECRVSAEIFCSAGEGIECGSLVPPSDGVTNCIVSAVYTFLVENAGATTITINSATVSINGGDSMSILPPVDKRELAPNEILTGNEFIDLDTCATFERVTVFEVIANGDNENECEDTDTYVYQPLRRRRALRQNVTPSAKVVEPIKSL
jgi:hypothetical protein